MAKESVREKLSNDVILKARRFLSQLLGCFLRLLDAIVRLFFNSGGSRYYPLAQLRYNISLEP